MKQDPFADLLAELEQKKVPENVEQPTEKPENVNVRPEYGPSITIMPFINTFFLLVFFCCFILMLLTNIVKFIVH